jgi:hypothetical protein
LYYDRDDGYNVLYQIPGREDLDAWYAWTNAARRLLIMGGGSCTYHPGSF